jgi:predicted DNA-binding mobile mystery protein A
MKQSIIYIRPWAKTLGRRPKKKRGLYMKPEFRDLRIRQLERTLAAFNELAMAVRPSKGWIRALREALGITLTEFAASLVVAPSTAAVLEKSEAEYRITLRSLRKAATALDCQLVYALVPREGSLRNLHEQRLRALAEKNVSAVEHSMALEDQAVGRLSETIESEANRVSRRRQSKTSS